MDPHLFDIVWEVYRESGSSQPIDVLSGYRSPQTNAMLRQRSRQVAEHSAHMAGKAMDAHFIDVGTARIRDIAMRMEAGGVGFYPTGITPWVHIDSGPVRYWPRMSRDALARLFPDGKTVFIPADGQPMPGYEQARAEIEARGGQVQVATGGGLGIFGWLFGARGGGADDAEEEGGGEATGVARGGRGGGDRRSRLRRRGRTRSPGPSATCRPARPTPAPSSPRRSPPNRRASTLGRTRSPGPSATCRPARPTPARSNRRRRRRSNRRSSRRWLSPTPQARLRRVSRRAPLGRSSWRRCRRGGRPISTSRSRSPTRPCLRRVRPISS